MARTGGGSRVDQKKLVTQIREKAWENREGIYMPRTQGDIRTSWPVCQTCLRDVEAVELKNRNTKGVELWARCHGKEDWYTIVFPYEIPENDASGEKFVTDHVRMAMRAFRPFVPSIA